MACPRFASPHKLPFRPCSTLLPAALRFAHQARFGPFPVSSLLWLVSALVRCTLLFGAFWAVSCLYLRCGSFSALVRCTLRFRFVFGLCSVLSSVCTCVVGRFPRSSLYFAFRDRFWPSPVCALWLLRSFAVLCVSGSFSGCLLSVRVSWVVLRARSLYFAFHLNGPSVYTCVAGRFAHSLAVHFAFRARFGPFFVWTCVVARLPRSLVLKCPSVCACVVLCVPGSFCRLFFFRFQQVAFFFASPAIFYFETKFQG